MKPLPTISVIIPTYNRKDSLLRALDSLGQQTYPMDKMEAIIVDDGSTDDTHSLVGQQFPFNLCYLQQKNQGATAARNYGARTSKSDILIFIDDDITVSPQTLESFAEKFDQSTKTLLMGTINKRNGDHASVYTSVERTMADHSLFAQDDVEIQFVDCNTELLACKRQDFFEIGMFQDPTGGNGWPNWDDVDFGYRAHQKGFRLAGTSKAIAEHWDYSISNWTIACQRFYRAGRSAVWLFNKHPELKTLIPMLCDKTPPAWGQDSLRLIVRKFARRIMSSLPVLGMIIRIVKIMEQYYPSPIVLRRLYYLLHGANLFQGYQAGLREFKLAGAKQ